MTDQDTEKDWGNVRYRPVSRRHAAAGDEAGSRFVIGLVVFIAVAFLPAAPVRLVLIALAILAALFPIVYSYVAWRQETSAR